MKKILIASLSASGAERLREMLPLPDSEITLASTAAETEQLAGRGEFDLVIINSPLGDLFGDDTARRIAGDTLSAVILLAKKDFGLPLRERVEACGAAVLTKPLSADTLRGAVEVSLIGRERMLRLSKKTAELRSRVEEAGLVGRAKCVLIQYLSMTEPQAHRYIEKQAMDMRMSKLEVARGILSAYET